MSQIRVHVSRAEDPVVPNTGLLTRETPSATSGTGTDFYFGLGIIIAIILVAILPAFFYKKWKKQGFLKKQLITRVLLLAVLSFGLSFAGLSFVKYSTENTLGASTDNELTATAGDVDIYVELEDEPVFASASSTIKVNKATDSGYILKSYASSTDLVLDTDSSKKIPGLTVSDPSAMTENTWGISLAEAENQDTATWRALPTAQANTMTIKDVTTQTAVNDQTTVYYGVYVSPETEPGIYVSTVNYVAKPYFIMQNVSEWGDSIDVSEEVLAIDTRDGQKYSVARLKDGKLWMTQNLDLGRTNLTVDLTSGNTNLATTVTADTFNSWKKTSGTATYDAGEFISIDGVDETSKTPYGTLYNYYVASAGTILGNSNSSSAIYDICPAGWRLPTGGDSGELQALYELYNSNALIRASIEDSGAAFALAGHFYNAAPSGQGTDGRYWSSTRYGDFHMYRLLFNTSTVSPADNGGRRIYGYSIRCIAREDFNIVYDGNAGSNNDTTNNVSGNMDSLKHENIANGSSVTLNAPNYIRPNYGFAGWSLDPEAGTKINNTNAPTIYGPNETITVSDELFPRNHNIVLYAVWVPVSTTYSMQTFNSSVFSSEPVGYVMALRDERDNNSYAITKLDDGKFWMMQNIRLDLQTANITSSNTNNPTNDFLTNRGDAAPTETWCSSSSGEWCYSAIHWQKDDRANGYGYYYNWYGATAGNGTPIVEESDVDGDICPKGWHMPTGRSIDYNGEFAVLSHAFGGTGYAQDSSSGGAAVVKRFVGYPANFVRAGLLSDSIVQNRQNDENYPWYVAYYWSSTRRGNHAAYRHNFGVSPISPGTTDNHTYMGMSVRCVASPTINDLTYMQDFATLTGSRKVAVLSSMTEGEQYYLKDSRDNKTYRISKLKDGNVWMTQTLELNLADFAGTHNLTPANTDLVSDTAKTRGYWDPSGSVQDRIDSLSAELDARGLTHDFTGLSTLIIGQTQPQQYLSKEQTGYTFGSFIKDDGSFEAYPYETNSNSNSYTEIPRSYSGETTISYNWFAATAESGTLAMTTGEAEDSICPAGWQIPYGNEENHSWYNLFINAYSLETNGEESATAIRNAPFYLNFEGGYNWNSGVQNTSGTDGYYHTATARTNNVMFAVVHNMTTWVGTYGNGGKNGGAAIRCVTR